MTPQPRIRRSESFLGVHFDYHMREHCKNVGQTVTPHMVEAIIERVKPDYIQCDCKGHPGFSSYPTKVGNPALGFARDPLRIFREVTSKYGVALYMHYSGVIDEEAIRQHPDWAAIGADGKPDARATSVFGPYVDKLLIPQLIELCDEYQVDGVWVDGECWATVPDYGPAALAAFSAKTGIVDIPRSPLDRHYHAFLDFCRQGFRDYFMHYVDSVHQHNRQFQIAGNWAYSSHMPEPVGVDIDFISGDYTLQDSVNSARFEGRCMQHQGKPWDLMAWGFAGTFGEPDRSTKSVVQLQQEAAIVLALGGGFQAYYKQKPDASIYPWEMNIMGEVARFCRARQPICHKAQPVPQVAVLYSALPAYRNHNRLFINGAAVQQPMKGILYALIESQHVVDIVMDHHLSQRAAEYGAIVVPEWHPLEDSVRAALVAYARDGGALVVVGSAACTQFQDEAGVRFGGDGRGRIVRNLWWNERGMAIRTHLRPVESLGNAECVGRHFANNDPEDTAGDPPAGDAALVTAYGSGSITLIPLDLGEQYYRSRLPVIRDLLSTIVDKVFAQPTVTVRGAGARDVDVTLATQGETTVVNLVNTSGPHANRSVFVFEELTAVGPVELTIRRAQKPNQVRVEPEGQVPTWQYADGLLRVTVARVPIHVAVTVD